MRKNSHCVKKQDYAYHLGGRNPKRNWSKNPPFKRCGATSSQIGAVLIGGKGKVLRVRLGHLYPLREGEKAFRRGNGLSGGSDSVERKSLTLIRREWMDESGEEWEE